MVGLPNVGKSSLINSLKRSRVAQVGNAPGVTRAVQQVNLDKHINLLDSPGIAFSDAASNDNWAALRNCVKVSIQCAQSVPCIAMHCKGGELTIGMAVQVEQLDDPQSIVAEILQRCSAKQLMALYKVPAFKDADEFLQHVAFQRGKLLPSGVGDAHSAACVVLHDWHNGKIAYYTMPPKRGDGKHEDAQIVTAWSEAFNAEKVRQLCHRYRVLGAWLWTPFDSEASAQVYANESNAVIAGLPSLEDTSSSFFPTTTAGTAAGGFDSLEAGEPLSSIHTCLLV